jgi:uncharacterized protein YlxW (UPF0749 family)
MAEGPGHQLPDRVLMPLLDRIRSEPLGQDYEVAAARRRAHPAAAAEPRSSIVGRGVTVLLVGVVGTVAITQTSQQATADESSRPALIDRIGTRRAALASIQRDIGDLRNEIRRAGARQRSLLGRLDDATAESRRLRVRTGYAAVRGPGLRILVDDPPDAGTDDAVRAADLALLVNGLWTAGAEAVTVNGQRLTALTYIQNSGPVIHVNSQPLTAPYTVEAIGDPRTMPADLLESPTGARFADYARLLGFRFDRRTVTDLRLPAARLRDLRAATIGSKGDVSMPAQQGGLP